KEAWIPPVLKAQALEGIGIDIVIDKIQQYQNFMNNNLEIKLNKEKKKIENILLEICKEVAAEKLFESVETHLDENDINLILDRKKDPYSVGRDVIF
ncbi:MAG: hypothetical protein VX794_03345, partial [Nitrospinota bacterium]|nr:hypothetical protein [Nitrospinota bacterium]